MDPREYSASYYDLNPEAPNDIPFYIPRIGSSNPRVLELGCGTGRVLLPRTKHCEYIHGIDQSEAMQRICRDKLAARKIPSDRAYVQLGDITNFDLGHRFDLVIAPFRVLQNLESDYQLEGLFSCIRRHLLAEGKCILNVFNPNRSREDMKLDWCREEESFQWQVIRNDRRFPCHERRPRLDPEKLILYPELIYRTFKGNALIDQRVLKISMRCHYPDDFEALIRNHGLVITNRWGGYNGEPYAEGPELIIGTPDQIVRVSFLFSVFSVPPW